MGRAKSARPPQPTAPRDGAAGRRRPAPPPSTPPNVRARACGRIGGVCPLAHGQACGDPPLLLFAPLFAPWERRPAHPALGHGHTLWGRHGEAWRGLWPSGSGCCTWILLARRRRMAHVAAAAAAIGRTPPDAVAGMAGRDSPCQWLCGPAYRCAAGAAGQSHPWGAPQRRFRRHGGCRVGTHACTALVCGRHATASNSLRHPPWCVALHYICGAQQQQQQQGCVDVAFYWQEARWPPVLSRSRCPVYRAVPVEYCHGAPV